jgi:hypothetical protein
MGVDEPVRGISALIFCIALLPVFELPVVASAAAIAAFYLIP